ncbi:MAG: histidinol dehydrogenase, partial [Candidatus Binatia bacterium]
MKTGDRRFKRTLRTIIQRRDEVERKVEGSVRKIIQAVRQDGDSALSRYARIFDGYRMSSSDIEVKPREIDRAMK